MLSEKERYEKVDIPFYEREISLLLPEHVLDFHAHVWRSCDWKQLPWQTDKNGDKYMVTEKEYPFERLEADARMIFPDRAYNAVCFGYPTPFAEMDKTNEYSRQALERRGLFPLLIAGRNTHAEAQLREMITEQGYYGYKVFLNWQGDDYGNIAISDMIGDREMSLADELKLIVLLHVPGSGRLADTEIQKGVTALARKYPGAQIVLAHCGRCYLPDEMRKAVNSIKAHKNIYLDTSMVMEPDILKIVFDNIESSRVLFATDFPVAAMRGRRVYAMDHWVDIVLEGYAPSAFRVASNGIRATFMAWEIILAIKRAGEMAGLNEKNIRDVFYCNGMKVLRKQKRGK